MPGRRLLGGRDGAADLFVAHRLGPARASDPTLGALRTLDPRGTLPLATRRPKLLFHAGQRSRQDGRHRRGSLLAAGGGVRIGVSSVCVVSGWWVRLVW